MGRRSDGAVLENGRVIMTCKRCHQGGMAGRINVFRDRVVSNTDTTDRYDSVWICPTCEFSQKWRGAIKRR